ncbi:conserved hypothetical protein [Microsporum canis CBS 113480]|uniref:J domain-containing protein n=1 Tax=Arthroderma otae (strain ATCC MYA-4605 / CBS 113480) TaxID=554155 RepID=C5FTH4_ARTOC|nr:conserved hypothetical protein [Microsporum canis CBS 113480]EEQ33177.1 conserved hypothetical protein [Microsporum canis CBS 113480]
MDAASRVLSFAGWAFLPGLATSFLQNFYYRITIRAGSPHPQPGSSLHTRHNRRIHVAVISSYLLYTIYEEYRSLRLAGDFYSLLGVLPTSDERTIKTRFRRLAALFHPDKARQTSTASALGNMTEEGGDVDAFFVMLRLAQDTLLDPVKRFAYDRFGAGVVDRPEGAGKALSMGAYFYEGLFALVPQYLAGFLMMVVLNMFWFSAWARYLTLLTHPNATFIPSAYLPATLSKLLRLDTFYLLPFQMLSLARTASVTINIFISQLTPPEEKLRAGRGQGQGEEGLSGQTQRQLTRIVQLAQAQDAEAAKLLGMDMLPFAGDADRVARLRRGMKERLSRDSVREAPEVQQAVQTVIGRRNNSQKGEEE